MRTCLRRRDAAYAVATKQASSCVYMPTAGCREVEVVQVECVAASYARAVKRTPLRSCTRALRTSDSMLVREQIIDMQVLHEALPLAP
jgi:hypothetical protein